MKSFLTSFKSRAAALRSDDPHRFRLLLGLSIAAIIFLVVLLWLDAPWQGETGKRIADGKKLHVLDYARLGSWYAAAANLLLLLTLTLTSRWWWKWAKLPVSAPADPPKFARQKIHLFTWLGLLAAIVLALWIRVPQMNRFLMFDEQDNLRRSIHGYAENDKRTGEPTFVEAGWTDAFFENRLANNPILMSVASKASLTVWQKFSGKGKLYFSRPALRLPSLVGGVLSLAAFWWFMVLLRMPLAGVLSAFFLAFHPFHIDYCIQARGYGLMFLFVGTSACCALLALRTGRWRWFTGLGLSLALVLASYSGASYFVLVFGASIAAHLIVCWFVRGKARAVSLFTRLAVVGALSGGLYLQLIAPSYPQMKAWLMPAEEDGDGFSHSELPPQWIPDAYTQYTTGGWFGTDPKALGLALQNDRSYAILILVVIPLLTLVGFVRIFAQSGAARAILLAGCLAPVAAYCVHQYITHLWLHGWYILYFLPFFAIMLGAGLAWICLRLHRHIPAAGSVLAAAIAALFFTYFWNEVRPNSGKPGRRALQSTPLDPFTGKDFTVYNRTAWDWVIYEDGRMMRQPAGQPIPEKFPFEESELDFKDAR